MPRVIGLKKYTHTLLVLSTLILFLKSSRLKSYVVVGGWQNRKTKVSKQSMMKQGGYYLKKTNFIFTKSRVRSLRRSWDEINTHYKLSALLGHCKNILPPSLPKKWIFFLIIDSKYYVVLRHSALFQWEIDTGVMTAFIHILTLLLHFWDFSFPSPIIIFL